MLFSVDFGRIVAGFVELDLEAPPGTAVDMHYREKVFRPELAWSGEDPETGARDSQPGLDDDRRPWRSTACATFTSSSMQAKAAISNPEAA